MRMRLIDADEFKKQIAGMAIINNYPADKANKMCELIDRQPTAYDVDKIMKELEELRDFKANQFNISKYGLMQMVIEHVKSGGIK